MVTPLTTLGNLDTIFQVAPGDTSQDALLNLYIAEASQAICSYCTVKDFGLVNNTDILSGNNDPAIFLRQIPMTGFTYTGTTTFSSSTITGLSSTTGLFLNQSVNGPGIPSGAVINSIGSGTITLTTASGNPATATATATGASLWFGVALWYDNYALGGSSPNAFPQKTLLIEGQDYYCDYDNGPGGFSHSGVIWSTNTYWNRNAIWVWGLITPQNGPPMNNVKVTYASGYATIPADLQNACELLIAHMRVIAPFGKGVQSLGDGKLSVSLSAAAKTGFLDPEVSGRLLKYKKVIVG